MFSFYMPTKVIAGEGCVRNHASLLSGFGKKALIVTGRNSAKKNGSLKDVQEALESIQVTYCLFDEIEENPSLETVEKAKDFGADEKADFIIGIGGGSAIDAAKAIAVMLKNTHLTAGTLVNGESLESVPVIAVPTTAGTGTEVTQYAIVTDHDAQTKKNIGHIVFPKIAFLDASYMKDMSATITIHTAVDALSHLVESYLNVKSNVFSEGLVVEGLKLWGKCIPHLLSGAFNLECRHNLLMASMLGGVAIAQTGTSLPHGMGYALTYHKGLSHGLANGVLYVAYLRSFKDQSKVQKIHQHLGLESHEALEKILETLCHTEAVLTKEEIAKYTDEMCANKAKLQNHPEAITRDEVYTIYEKSLL